MTTKVQKLEQERDAGTTRKVGKAQTVAEWLTYWADNIAAPNVATRQFRATALP